MSNSKTTYRNDSYDSATDTYTIQISEYIGRWKTDPEVLEWYLADYPDAKKVIIEMSSQGGDPISAIEVGNKLKRLQKNGIEVEGDVVGFVASAATILLVAGCPLIRMERNSMWLIHELEGYMGWVTAKQAETEADNLHRIENLLIDIYVRKTGKTDEEIRNLLMQGIWLSAAEALEWGFVDELYDDAEVDATKFQNNVHYQNFVKKGGKPVPPIKLKNSKNIQQMETKEQQQQQQKPEVKKTAFDKFINAAKGLFVVVEDTPPVETTDPPVTPPVKNAKEVTPPAVEPPVVPEAKVIDLKNHEAEVLKLKNEIEQLRNTPAGKTTTTVTKVTPPTAIVVDGDLKNKGMFTTTFNNETGKYQLKKNPLNANRAELEYLKNSRPHQFKEQVALMTRNNCCPDFAADPLSGANLAALEAELGNLTAHVPALNEIMINAFNLGVATNIVTVGGGILDHKYYSIIGEVGEVIQPINGCNYNSKGDMAFEPFGNVQRGWKIDKDVCPTNFYSGYFSYLNSNNFSPWDHPFVTYFIMKLIEGGVRDDINLASWFGEYDKTSTNASAVYDGYWKIVNDNITAANIIAMPAFNPATDSAVDYIEEFVAGFPEHWLYSTKPISINIPTHIAAAYLKEYREKYNSECCFTDNGGNPLQELQIWQKPNMRLVPTLAMGTGDRLIATIDGTLYYRRGNSVNSQGNPMVQMCKRSLATMIDVIGCSMISTVNKAYLLVSDQPEAQYTVDTFNTTGLPVAYPSLTP